MNCSDVKWQFLTHAGNALLFILGGGGHIQNTEVPDGTIVCSTRQIARKILPERTKFFSLPGFSFLCYFTRGESVQHDVPEKENSDIAVKTFFWNHPEKKIKTSNTLPIKTSNKLPLEPRDWRLSCFLPKASYASNDVYRLWKLSRKKKKLPQGEGWAIRDPLETIFQLRI